MKKKSFSCFLCLLLVLSLSLPFAAIAEGVTVTPVYDGDYLVKTLITDAAGNLTLCDKGYAMIIYRYKNQSRSNQPTTIYFQGVKGHMVESVDGYCYENRSYRNGLLSERTYYNRAEIAVLGPDGYHKMSAFYDDEGRLYRIKLYNAKLSQKIISSVGYASLEVTYTKNGQLESLRYLTPKEKPVDSFMGFATIETVLDANGYVSRLNYLHADGTFATGPNGYAEAIFQNDVAGNVTSAIYLTEDGLLTEPTGENYATLQDFVTAMAYVTKTTDPTEELLAMGNTLATPTPVPTATPTPTPTVEPTVTPTVEPTAVPTVEPIPEPTIAPTAEPTAEPTAVPTATPTAVPTATPTAEPTATPTVAPTATPTAVPATAVPNAVATTGPTIAPTVLRTAGTTATPIISVSPAPATPAPTATAANAIQMITLQPLGVSATSTPSPDAAATVTPAASNRLDPWLETTINESATMMVEAWKDYTGAYITGPDGWSSHISQLDQDGRVTAESWYDVDGNKITNGDTYVTIVYTYSDAGYVNRIKYFDLSGNLVECNDGYAIMYMEYDANGQLIYEKYFGDMGFAKALADGTVSRRYNYDEKGNLLGVTRYDYSDNPLADD